MTLCVTVEHRFDRTPDGLVWTRSNHSYADFRRYLDAFDGVRVLARVREVAAPPPGAVRADGCGVSFAALPYYVGFKQFCLRWRAVRQAALEAIGPTDAVILKAPSPLSCLIEPALRKARHPYALQLIGDPWGSYAKGSMSHPLRPIVQQLLTRLTTAQCLHADAVCYVTSRALQARYPARSGVFEAAITDVDLPLSAFARFPRSFAPNLAPVRIVTVAALEQPYKGLDVLLKALHRCSALGLDFRFSIVGDGRLRPTLTALAARLGIADRVDFLGALPGGEKVREVLNASDLFILPSRHEGLPRAMMEAMAQALPCLGSDVGGIPELLPREDLFPSGDPDSLARKILEVCASPRRMERSSQQNLTRAKDFAAPVLAARWRDFFSHVRDLNAASPSEANAARVEVFV